LRKFWKGKEDQSSGEDSNEWRSIEEEEKFENQPDWQEELAQKESGSYWSSFEPSEDEKEANGSQSGDKLLDEDVQADAWLESMAVLANEEVEFNRKEADRADKARQMEEWGFDGEAIANSLGVATDASLETEDEVEGMQMYREEEYLDEVDLQTVESHTLVEKDTETGEPIRSQMVYVDEHECIGCTHCASVSPATFFMEDVNGRARVFNQVCCFFHVSYKGLHFYFFPLTHSLLFYQWGDDDASIETAIACCPVDCIHYVPYEELVSLEIDRRGQNINFKARLVSQAEMGAAPAWLAGGGENRFTAPQVISGNLGARCSNCPSRGCAECPMYGVGKNPVFEEKERRRKAQKAEQLLRKQREQEQKSAEL